MTLTDFRLTELRAARVEFEGEVQQLVGLDESETGGARWVNCFVRALLSCVSIHPACVDTHASGVVLVTLMKICCCCCCL